MTAAAYGTDLQIIDDCEDTTGWSEMTGRTSGGAATQEDRAYIQGSYSVSQSTGAATGRTVGLQYDYGSNVTWSTGYVVLMWQYWQAPKAIGTWADGGMRIAVGSSAGNVRLWNAQGNDYGRNPYGGWANVAIDPTYSYDETIGSPVAGNYRIFCSAPYLLQSVSKGNPHCVDMIRYGRAQIKIEYGDGTGYGTFAGMASANDADSARWGLFSYQLGTYIWKGLMSIGTATNAVDFRDANRNIIVDDTPRTYAAFNKIEIRNSSSRVDWTAIQISPLGTLSKGDFEVVDDCDVNFSSCTFTDMNTFIFKASSGALNCIFRRCNTITANGCDFTGSTFDQSSVAANTSALVWDVNTDPSSYLDNCTFTKGANAHHAIEFGTSSPTSMTLTNTILNGFNASNAQNDSAIHFKRTSGTVTLTISGGTTPSYRTDGATITIVTSSRTIKAIVQKADGTKIQSARVFLKTAATASGGFPYNVTVTITNSGYTATVSHTGHGMLTNDKVVISGASLAANNGVWSITKTTDDAYTYTMASSQGSSPTGTIKCSFVFLEGTTDINGELSMSRAIGANQTVIGWARKSSSAPYFREGPLGGTVSSSGDSTFTAVLSPDE